MPRLQILQHKSYHPYLEKNKQRVREDEAKAAAEELAREQKRIDADSADRLNQLRRRAGSPSFQPEDDNLPSTSTSKDEGDSLLERHRKEKARAEKRERKQRERLDFDFPSETARRSKGKEKELGQDEWASKGDEGMDGDQSVKWDVGGHLNFFADLENNPNSNKPVPTLAEIAKKKREQELDQYTMYLGRPDKETKPWYADKDLKRVDEKESGDTAEERREKERRKDMRSKERNDPMTSVNKLLSTQTRKPLIPGHRPNGGGGGQMSERERALALMAKSKQPSGWSETPSTQRGRSWIDDFERQKDKAGNRYFDSARNGTPVRERVEAWRGGGRDEGRNRTGRSWEV